MGPPVSRKPATLPVPGGAVHPGRDGDARHGRAGAAAAQPRGPRQGGRHRGPPVGRAALPRRGRGLVRAGVPGLRRPLPGAWPALRAEPRDPRSAVAGARGQRRLGRARPAGGGDAATAGQPPAPAGAHRGLCRPGPAAGGDHGRRLADVLLPRAELPLGVGEDPRPRRRGGSRPRLAHQRGPAADLRVVLVRRRRPACAGVRRRVLRRRRVERVHARQRHPRHAGAVRRAARRACGGRRGAHRPGSLRLRPRPGRADRRRGAAGVAATPGPGLRGTPLGFPGPLRREAGVTAPLPARRLREELGRKPHVLADKLVPAEAAVRLVRDGDHVAIGGTLYSRTPMALLFELLRSGRSGLTISRPRSCYEAELFLVGGMADGIVTSWVGIGLPWGISRVVRELVEGGLATYEEWSHLALGLRYKAGAMGVPFLPTLTMLGSDLARTLGLQTVDCPYTGEQLAAVPALNP